MWQIPLWNSGAGEPYGQNGIPVVRLVKQLYTLEVTAGYTACILSLFTGKGRHGRLFGPFDCRHSHSHSSCKPQFGPVVMDLHFLLCQVICSRTAGVGLNIPPDEIFSVREGTDSTVNRDFLLLSCRCSLNLKSLVTKKCLLCEGSTVVHVQQWS